MEGSQERSSSTLESLICAYYPEARGGESLPSLDLTMADGQGKETARLVEDEIMDKKKWSEFVKTE